MTAPLLSAPPGYPVPDPRAGLAHALATRPASPITAAEQALHRVARTDYPTWLGHVRSAAACTRPVRLAGAMLTVEPGTGRVLSRTDTATLPDGVLYKPCGSRLASVCPSCAKRYQRDAFQVMRGLLLGGDPVPESVTQHPAAFVTFTAPSFGPVHTREVRKHTCAKRSVCTCRAEPCRARRDHPICPHSRPLACWTRHKDGDRRLGKPMCADCYDYPGQVVWNVMSAELWRRTHQNAERYLARLAKQRGIPFTAITDARGRTRYRCPIRITYGKSYEMQRRGAVHFHAVMRLDRVDPSDPNVAPAPPAGFDVHDLVAAVLHAVRVTAFTTDPHPIKSEGWPIFWGIQIEPKPIAVAGDVELTPERVAYYVAKYTAKGTEDTGDACPRLTGDTVDLYADAAGSHVERLRAACWVLGQPPGWRELRYRAHLFGGSSHVITKSRRHRMGLGERRQRRISYRRAMTTKPATEDRAPAEPPTTLDLNLLQYVGAGWHTTGDALLANTSAALAREYDPYTVAELAIAAV